MSSAVTRKAFPFDEFEPRWQRHWEANRSFRTPNPGDEGFDASKPKYFVLDMFPYPSGNGLHVGHPEGYTATDIVARYKRKNGFNVLHPMGWDAFGLPAEQYAIKTGTHPRVTTEANVANFTKQLKSLGFAYDWDREVNTTDPGYFKWTQWIFLKLYNSYVGDDGKAHPISELEAQGLSREEIDHRRLAYVSEAPVNWCPQLGTVLANEEVVDGKSEVGGFPVERRPMRQWMLRITSYAQRLIDELDGLDWPESIKLLQRNWIGRSEGAHVKFSLADASGEVSEVFGWDQTFTVFTTRPDTLFGATYMVLAPEHPRVADITTTQQRSAVETYQKAVSSKSDLERTELAKEKSGVFTGAYAINPVNNERIPIWIADYVLMGYGTGAIMAVPAHDERDFEFAKKFELPIKQVVAQGGVGFPPAGSTSTAAPQGGVGVPPACAPSTAAPSTAAPSTAAAQGGVGFQPACAPSTAAPSTAAPSTAAPQGGVGFQPACAPSTAAPSTAAPSTAAPQGGVGFQPACAPSTAAPQGGVGVPPACAPSTAAPSTAAPSTAAPQGGVGFQPACVPSTAAPSSAAPAPATFSPFAFFESGAGLRSTQRDLPHWNQGDKYYFFTWRLADSLPAEKLNAWHDEKAEWLSKNPQPWTDATEAEFHTLFSDRIEQWLDQGHGSQLLADPRANEIVASALRHFDGDRYHLACFAVMPNHVHVLVRLAEGQDTSAILHSWKSYTANELNKLTGKDGPVWQAETFDRIVRNERHFAAVWNYLLDNPVKAGLTAGQFSSYSATLDGAALQGQQAGWKPTPPCGASLDEAAQQGQQAGWKPTPPCGASLDEAAQQGQQAGWKPTPPCGAAAGAPLQGQQAGGTPTPPLEAATCGDGIAVNSGFLDGLPTPEAKKKITAWLEEKGLGKGTTNFKLRDWLFSRQRYWGEPFPIVWENGQHRSIPESELPLLPPTLEDFKPTGTPEPPLSKATDWVQYSATAKRELNTMPQWAGSCWYYLRYCDARNSERFVGEAAESYWMGGGKPGGVDLYVGGTEHAVLHLLYARFWHKVLFDLGYVSTPEPFQRLVNQGLILGEDGQKMSKSRGNVVNPDDVVREYGADALRLYEMFMGPLEQVKPWSMKGVEGVYRFLARVWRLIMEENQEGTWTFSAKIQDVEPGKKLRKVVHETIRKVGIDCEALSFNTAISAMMVCTNELTGAEVRPLSAIVSLLHVLNPYAPHLSEELYARLREAFPSLPAGLLSDQPWPEFNPAFLIDDELEIVIQVNGKVRDKVTVPADISNGDLEALALAQPKVLEHTAAGEIKKVIVVPKRLVNIVVAPAKA